MALAEEEKMYSDVTETRWAFFTPFVVSVYGNMDREANPVLQCIVEVLSIKWSRTYNLVVRWIKASPSFSILPTTLNIVWEAKDKVENWLWTRGWCGFAILLLFCSYIFAHSYFCLTLWAPIFTHLRKFCSCITRHCMSAVSPVGWQSVRFLLGTQKPTFLSLDVYSSTNESRTVTLVQSMLTNYWTKVAHYQYDW